MEREAYLVRAFHFRRIMRVVGIDCKREYECATLVHAWQLLRKLIKIMHDITFVRRDGEGKVEEIGRIREMGFHRRRKIQLSQICKLYYLSPILDLPIQNALRTFLYSNLGGTCLRLPLCGRILIFLHTPYLLRSVGCERCQQDEYEP